MSKNRPTFANRPAVRDFMSSVISMCCAVVGAEVVKLSGRNLTAYCKNSQEISKRYRNSCINSPQIWKTICATFPHHFRSTSGTRWYSEGKEAPRQ